MAALSAKVDEIRAEGRLPEVGMLRNYGPGERVAARLEISTGGILRGRAAGVDVMGDGSLIPYCGGVTRETLEPRRGESELDALRRKLESLT